MKNMNIVKNTINWLKAKKAHYNYIFKFLKVLNSPLRPLKLKWYFGEIAIGHPYFLPRKLVKSSDIEKRKKGVLEFKPIKWFGFTYNTLGWKTKWDEYRYEWNPALSLILFGKQLAVIIKPDIPEDCMDDIYWEAWLTYENETNKKLSKKDRLIELKKIYSCIWEVPDPDSKRVEKDFYPDILKKKYR